MMNIHSKRHHKLSVLRFILAPGYHRGKEFPFAKHMDVEMLVSDPRQAGHIKEIRRLVFRNSPNVLILFTIAQKAGMKFQQVRLKTLLLFS